jgi:hypothetical protein
MISGNLGFKLVCHLQNGNRVHWKKKKKKKKTQRMKKYAFSKKTWVA